nr:PTS sugar transporter subunit IIA [Spirochaetota bacterium]
FKALLKCPKSDIAILLTTFFLTVVFDLTVAIQVGILLALLLFIRNMNLSSNINVINDEYVEEKEIYDPFATNRLEIPKGVEVYEINGAFFFGAVEKFKNQMLGIEKPPKIRSIRMKRVPTIDSSGLKLLEDIYKDSKKNKTSLILSGVNEIILKSIKKVGLNKLIGDDNILPDIQLAMARSKVLLGINEPTIGEKIRRGGIHYSISGNDPFEVIEKAMKSISFNPNVNLELLKKSLIEREGLMYTGVGNGIAMPHSRNPVVANPEEEIIAICLLEKEVNYDAIDKIPVHTAIFVISSNPKSHLENISSVAKLCSKKDFVNILKNKKSENDIFKYIDEYEKKISKRR